MAIEENDDVIGSRRMTYFIGYMTLRKGTGEYYYGQHETDNKDDGYMGSGSDLLTAMSEYGRDKFMTVQLRYFDNAIDLNDWEKRMVTSREVNDPKC